MGDYKYRVTGPRGGKYLTTTRLEAEKLTRHGGKFQALGQRKASKVKNPVWRGDTPIDNMRDVERLVGPITFVSQGNENTYFTDGYGHGYFFKDPTAAERRRLEGYFSGRLRNPSPGCIPSREVSALFAEGTVPKDELREMFPDWFDGKGKQVAGFFRITLTQEGDDGTPVKVGIAIPLRAKHEFSRQWRGITKHWGFRRKESFKDIKKSLMIQYYLNVLKLCMEDHPYSFDAAITTFLGQMDSYL
jgi:hypothetical protein